MTFTENNDFKKNNIIDKHAEDHVIFLIET